MRQNPFPSSTLRARALRDDNTMNSLLHPNPNPNLNPSSFCFSAARRTTLSNLTNWIPFRLGERRIGLSTPRKGRHPAVRSAATIDEAGFLEADIRNPAISTSYRPSKIPQPNRVVLEAQTKVCTGPEQTKPLSQEQAVVVLDTILRSARGELKNEEVSKAQLGAFFAAMTIRANAFPEATQWSEGERHAMSILWPRLVQVLPQDVIFIADPEGTIMGPCSSIGPHFVGHGAAEMRLVGALREVLAGGHLGYEEVQGVLRDVLPLNPEDDTSVKVSESLLAAFLIGQRMNREIDRELKAYCLAFDDELGSPPIADVRSLTHYGEPYDGNTRFLRSTLFVAAVRACYDESCLLHGVEWMPPKGGITEGQLLKFMGANTYLSPAQAKTLLEDENIGFAYVSQREACPSLYSLIGLREHIKKRPPLATSEKVQQFVRARGRESIVAGFYHEGYEDPLLMLMRRRKVHSGLVVKGEEGALSMTTKVRSVNASKGLPVNHCSGFRSPSNATNSDVDGISRESFSIEVNAKDYGFEPTDTPRTDRSVLRNIELGLAALGGEKGPAYDRIVLNAGMVDHLLGCSGAGDIMSALDRAREAIDSGKALNRLMNYIQASHKVT
ncbi:anthranilate phosphoribosyltransferase isoform X4 [Phoenix dactylifera]|uniref:Anthranilate phosphoribosyltransferase isoform X4 n=1 Tax=Phoenix dactylifera TaxID=42345 RepID=A0A8B7BTD2_PHODC|nr:anthranilate phosphoribosyltransferase isoform X4 [Phoenix dactylifera]